MVCFIACFRSILTCSVFRHQFAKIIILFLNSKLWAFLLTEALEICTDYSANVMYISRELKYYTITLNQRDYKRLVNEDEIMLKVLAFYSELKCIRKYVLRIGHRECKCKVEEKKMKKLHWAGEGEMERARRRPYLARVCII